MGRFGGISRPLHAVLDVDCVNYEGIGLVRTMGQK